MERAFQLLPGMVRVSLEHGRTAEEIVPILSDAARLAWEKRRQALLVVSGLDDPATSTALSQALEEIRALGAPTPFRIAFVACMLPQYSVYHFAERYAEKLGIVAKVLVSVRDAETWLGGAESVRAREATPGIEARARS